MYHTSDDASHRTNVALSDGLERMRNRRRAKAVFSEDEDPRNIYRQSQDLMPQFENNDSFQSKTCQTEENPELSWNSPVLKPCYSPEELDAALAYNFEISYLNSLQYDKNGPFGYKNFTNDELRTCAYNHPRYDNNPYLFPNYSTNTVLKDEQKRMERKNNGYPFYKRVIPLDDEYFRPQTRVYARDKVECPISGRVIFNSYNA